MVALVLVAAAGARAQEDALAAVAAQVRRGEVEGALEALRALPEPARTRLEARYLEGRLAERAGEHDAAIAALAEVADRSASEELPPEIVRDARARRARLLARRGRCDEAETILGALGSLDARERALRAECALARGALADAERMLAREADADARDVDSFALRVMLAEAQARGGARDRAIATLRGLSIARPEHPDAARVEEALAALAGAPVEWTLDEHLARAERLGDARMHDEAIAELDGLPRPRDRALARRLLHARGMALFSSRHAYAEAAEVLAQAAAIPGSPSAIEDAFHAARALSRSGDDAAAIRAYRRIVRRAPSSAEAAESEYLAAWLELRLASERGRRRGAARAMERFLAGPRSGRVPRLAREARWHLALDALRSGAHRRAAELFAAYAREDADVLVRGRGTYWRARALDEAGDREAAIETYRATMRVEPLHWYALLARQRLTAMGEDPGAPFAAGAREETWSPSRIELPAAARVLRSLGLDRDARELVRARERELRGSADLRALVHAYEELGDHGRAFRLVARRDELDRPALGGEAWAWRAAYPRAFEGEVAGAARAQGLEPELLWGIMRQESAYDPDAVSYADAIGLLQMLPSTGERVARGMGVPFRRAMLFDPEWNARLGAVYVRGLVDAHGVPLAFAAFNAGGHRVDEWLARSGEIDLDLFVEEIPFDQTRNYVRRVTTHYAHYLYLRDPSAGWPALELPLRVAPRPRAR